MTLSTLKSSGLEDMHEIMLDEDDPDLAEARRIEETILIYGSQRQR